MDSSKKKRREGRGERKRGTSSRTIFKPREISIERFVRLAKGQQQFRRFIGDTSPLSFSLPRLFVYHSLTGEGKGGGGEVNRPGNRNANTGNGGKAARGFTIFPTMRPACARARSRRTALVIADKRPLFWIIECTPT